MEVSMRTGPSSYVVCDIEVAGWKTESGNEVMIRITPRDKVYNEVMLDLSMRDGLDLIAAVASELRK
jgi:hypothetical protein